MLLPCKLVQPAQNHKNKCIPWNGWYDPLLWAYSWSVTLGCVSTHAWARAPLSLLPLQKEHCKRSVSKVLHTQAPHFSPQPLPPRCAWASSHFLTVTLLPHPHGSPFHAHPHAPHFHPLPYSRAGVCSSCLPQASWAAVYQQSIARREHNRAPYIHSFLALTSTGTAYSDLLSQSLSPFPGYKTESLEFGVNGGALVEKQSPFIW